MQKIILNLIAIICLGLLSSETKAQLIPDSSFGQNGYFITSFPQTSHAYKIHELDNGQVLAIGARNGRLRVWRYSANGQIDLSFGVNGEASNASLDLEPGSIHALDDFEIYDDGKIIVLAKQGLHNLNNFDSSTYSIILASFNANGSVNTSFNSVGYLKDNPNTFYEYAPRCIIQAEEDNSTKFYVGSEAYERGHSSCPAGFGKWCISKYNVDGSKNTAFNFGGYLQRTAGDIAQASVTTPHARIRDMRLMNNGSIRVTGALHNFDKQFFDMAILPSGQYDSSFATNGRSTHAVTFNLSHGAYHTGSKIMDDGSALFFSTWYNATHDSNVISMIKTDPNANLNTTFGTNGVFTFMFPTRPNPKFIYKSDNSFLLSYYRKYGTDQKIEFMRIKSHGEVDLNFGTNGIQFTQPRVPDDFINASSVFHGIWDKTETKILVSASKQPASPAQQINYGIFKYDWPALNPLSISSSIKNNKINVFPNPIDGGQTLRVGGLNLKDNIQLVNINGQHFKLETIFRTDKVGAFSIPADMSSGVYFLTISNSNSKTTRTLIIK